MRTITRSILMVTVAILVSWGLAANEVRAMAGACEQLAYAERLKEEVIPGLETKEEETDSRRSDAQGAYDGKIAEMAEELGFYIREIEVGAVFEKGLPRWIENARARGDDEYADRLQAYYDELEPLYEDLMAAIAEHTQASEALTREENRLEAIQARRHALWVECGLVTEMSDPMSSFDRRVTRPVDPRPVPGDGHSAQAAEASGTDQMESNPSFTAEIMQVEQSESTSSGKKLVGYTTMPVPHASAIKTTSNILEAARLFNNLPAGTSQDGNQSTPSVTAQTMQVQQPANTSTSSNTFVYTHMRIPQNAGQSSAAVTPRKSLRAIPFIKGIRVHPGRSSKR
jgi:hypothetical protein